MADFTHVDNVGIDSYMYQEYDTSDESKELENQINQILYKFSELSLWEIRVMEGIA
jgi:uncharacterized protein with PhoU and TrkA domain